MKTPPSIKAQVELNQLQAEKKENDPISELVEDAVGGDKHFVAFLETLRSHKRLNLPNAKRLRTVARIHGLPQSYKEFLFSQLGNVKVEFDVKLILAQIVKYATKAEKGFIVVSVVFDLLQSNDPNDDSSSAQTQEAQAKVMRFRSELVLALCSADLSSHWLGVLKNVRNINADAKNEIGFLCQMETDNENQQFSDLNRNENLGEFEVETENVIYKQGGIRNCNGGGKDAELKRQGHAVKAQNISTEKCHESSSEKEQLHQLNLAVALNSRNKSIQRSTGAEEVPPEQAPPGSSYQSWYRTTYYEIQNLREMATKGKGISSDDQDYLYGKLTGSHVSFESRSTVIKMIGEAFFHISKKQRVRRSHFDGLLALLLSNDDDFKEKFKVWVVKMVQLSVARDPHYFSNTCETTLNEYMNRITTDSSTKTIVFEIIADQSGDSNYQSMFRLALKSLERTSNDETKWNKFVSYISLQSVNADRAEELFDETVCNKLLELVQDDGLKTGERKQVAEILENYIEHEKTKNWFSCSTLNSKLARIVVGGSDSDSTISEETDSDSFDLEFETKTSELLDAVNAIVAKIEPSNEDTRLFHASLIRIVLKSLSKLTSSKKPVDAVQMRSMLYSIVKFCLIPDPVISVVALLSLDNMASSVSLPRVELLAPKLVENKFIAQSDLTFGSDVSSSTSSDESDDEDKICVSALAAKTILRSKKLDWSGGLRKMLSFIIQALDEGNEKQTRIIVSELLYLGSRKYMIPEIYLTQLASYTSDSVPDVKVFITCALANGIHGLTKGDKPINPDLIETLLDIYKYEQVLHDCKEYSAEINLNVLGALEQEARKTFAFFNVRIFNFLGSLLSSSNTNHDSLLTLFSILSKYCDSHSPGSEGLILPQVVINSLEIHFASYDSTISSKASEIFVKLILTGQSVPSTVVQKYFDDLFDEASQQSEEKRRETMRLIRTANENQDLVDSQFELLVMEVLGEALLLGSSNKESQILKLMHNRIGHGQRLTVSNFRAMEHTLRKRICINDVLKCLTLASENGQSIPSSLLETFDQSLDLTESRTLISFCTELLKNSQSLGPITQNWIYNSFHNDENSSAFLPLVLFSTKTSGRKLEDERTVRKLSTYLQESLRSLDILEVLVGSSVSESFGLDTRKDMCKAFLEEVLLKDEASLVQGLKGINNLLKFGSTLINENGINSLVELRADCKNLEAQLLLTKILSRLKLNPAQEEVMGILNIGAIESDNEFLIQLKSFLKDHKKTAPLSPDIFCRLDSLLKKKDSASTILSLILKYILDRQPLSSKIMLSIASVLVTSTDKALTDQSLQILIKMSSKTTFSKELMLILESNFEKCESLLQVLSEGAHELSEETKFRFDLVRLKTTKSQNKTKIILERISSKLKSGFSLNSDTLETILALNSKSDIFYEVISILVLSEEVKLDEPLASFIGKSMLNTKHLKPSQLRAFELSVHSFPKILLKKGVPQFEKHLIRQFEMKSQTFETKLCILSSLAEISKQPSSADPGKGVTRIFLDNLKSPEPLVRKVVFRILSTLQSKGLSFPEFSNFLKELVEIIENEEENVKIFEASDVARLSEAELDILEVLVSLQNWDFKCFSRFKKCDWKKELVVSNFVACASNSILERMDILEKLYLLLEIQAEKYSIGETKFQILDHITKLLYCNLSPAKILLALESLLKLNVKFIEKFFNSGMVELNEALLWKEAIQVELRSKISNDFQPQTLIRIGQTLLLNLGFERSKKLLEKLTKIDDLEGIERILEILAEFKVQEVKIDKSEVEVVDLQLAVEFQILRDTLLKGRLQYALKVDRARMEALLGTMHLQIGFRGLLEILSTAAVKIESKTFKNLFTLEVLLRICLEYELKAGDISWIHGILRDNVQSAWIQCINEQLLKRIYRSVDPNSSLKGEATVAEDLKESLAGNTEVLNLIRAPTLIESMIYIREGKMKSKVKSKRISSSEICSWTLHDIRIWATKVRKMFRKLELSIEFEFNLEAVAIARRAYFLLTNKKLRSVQTTAILVGLNKGLRGQLQEVATGSGKSTIVAILAVINALRCKSVDIYTSNPVLAERDAKSWSPFYAMFGLTCSHNGDPGGSYTKGPKLCYKADIVYGETSMFQFDALRHSYSNLGTMGIRKHHFAIVDEVDSLLVDDLSKLARLSSLIPGMDLIQILYHMAWYRMTSIEEKLFSIGSSIYFVTGKVVHNEQGVASLKFANPSGQIMSIDDLAAYIQLGNNLKEAGIQLVTDINSFIVDHLTSFLKALTSDEKVQGFEISSEDKIKIPKNLRLFVQNQIPKWVENCITAYNYEENIHYVVESGQVKPVDYNTTGIIQDSTAWSGGLHQFLQIKHGLKLTSETLTTNFMSNVALFQKYKNKVYAEGLEFLECNVIGFTGTLGSAHTRKMLSDLYNVNCIDMPLTHFKRYVQYHDVVVLDRQVWLKAILTSISCETRRKRGVLVICETIKDARFVAAGLKAHSPGTRVKLYTQNNANQEDQIERIQPGEVFIATNLAGRGTDIKTSDIENYGGLHVCLTFLPNNIRVEEQAFGRTSRQGQLGSGQLICVSNLCSGSSVSELRVLRDKNQEESLDSFLENELPLVQAKDKCFGGFCKFLNSIRTQIRDEEKSQRGITGAMADFAIDLGNMAHMSSMQRSPSVREVSTLQAIEERWAMFLIQVDDRLIPTNLAWGYYKFLERSLRLDYKKEKVIHSPFYYIGIGNDLLSRGKDCFSRAKSQFDAAIKLDPDFAVAAYVGKGTLFLQIQDFNYKTNAILSLQKALPLIQTEIANCTTAQTLFQNRGGSVATDLFRQLTMKQNALNSYFNSVQAMLQVTRASLRRIGIVASKSDSESLRTQVRLPYGSEPINLVNRSFKFSDNVKDTSENSCKALHSEFPNFELSFSDLTVREDSGTIDQALKTIKKSGAEEGKIELHIDSVSLADLLPFFSEDRYAFDLMKEAALECLTVWDKENNAFLGLKATKKPCFTVDALVEEKFSNVVTGVDLATAKERIRSLPEQALFNITFKGGNAEKFSAFTKSNLDLEISNISDDSVGRSVIETLKCESKSIILTRRKEFHTILKKVKAKGPDIEIEWVADNGNGTWAIGNSSVFKLKSDDKAALEKAVELTLKNLNDKSVWFLLPLICKEGSTFNLKLRNLQNVVLGTSQEVQSWAKVLSGTEVRVRKRVEAAIPVLRDSRIPFTLVFTDLDFDKAKKIIMAADITQENMRKSSEKPLSTIFGTEFLPVTELWEFSMRGISIIYEFNENSSIPWFSIGCIVALAAVQAAIGGLLIFTGFGATLGMSLITEASADLMTAYRAYRNRQFSWGDYAKQKAVSLAISAISMGFSKLKDAATGVKALTEEAAKEAAEQAATQVISKGMTKTAVIHATQKELRTLAMKQVGVAVGEAAARECLNNLLASASQFAFSKMKPQILRTVELRVNETFFKNSALLKLLKLHWAFDQIGGKKGLESKIQRIVGEITNPKSDFFTRQWNSIAMPLLNGVLSSTGSVGSVASWSFRIAGILNGLKEITFVVQKVSEEITAQLTKGNTSVMKILVYECRLTGENAQELQTKIQLDTSHSSYFKFELQGIQNEKIKKYFMDLNRMQKLCDIEKDMDVILKSVSNAMAEHIARVADTQMRAPITTFMVSKTVSSISAWVQTNFVVSSENDAEDGEVKEEMTVADLINAKAKQFCIAYNEREIRLEIDKMSQDVGNSSSEGAVSQEVLDKAAAAITGAPADITVMAALAKRLDLKLSIVDKDYKITQEDIDSGRTIIRFEPGVKDPVTGITSFGHYSLIDPKTGQVVSIESSDADCGYASLATAAGMSLDEIKELRLQAGSLLLKSPETFDKVLNLEKRILDLDPKNFNANLLVGAGDGSKRRKLSTSENPIKSSNDIEIVRNETEKRKIKQEDGTEVEIDVLKKHTAVVPLGNTGENTKITELEKELRYLQKLHGDYSTVRAHLINAKLGGPNTKENLSLVSRSMNSVHHNQFEKAVKDLVKELGNNPETKLIIKTNVNNPGKEGDFLERADEFNISVAIEGENSAKGFEILKEKLESYNKESVVTTSSRDSGREYLNITIKDNYGGAEAVPNEEDSSSYTVDLPPSSSRDDQ